MENYSVVVPVKTHIRKYFCSRQGILGNTIVLNNRSYFGDMILTKICFPPLKSPGNNVLKLYCEALDDKIRFLVPIDMFYRIDNNLSNKHHYAINRFLQNTFVSDLHLIITIGEVFNVPKLKVIDNFLQKYDIVLEEDISMEAIRKSYNRFSKTPQAQSFFLARMSQPYPEFSFDLRD